MSAKLVRKSVWTAVIVAAIATLAVTALPFIASTQIVRDRIAVEMSAWSGYRVELGQAPEIKVWPLRAILGNVTLSGWNDPERKPVIVADRVEIELSALAALSGRVVFSTTRLIRPTLHLSLAGDKSLHPLSPGVGRIARAIAAAREAIKADATAPDLGNISGDPFGKLEFVDGHVVIQQSGKAEEIISDLSGALNWTALNRGGSLAATGIWRGESIVLNLTMPEPLLLFAGGTAPLSLSFKTAPANLVFGGFANLSQQAYLKGELDLSSPSVGRLIEWTTGQPVPGLASGAVAIKGTATGDNQRIRFENARITVDDKPGTGALDLSFGEQAPTLSGTLALDSLDIRPILTAIMPRETTGSTADVIDTIFADRLNLDLRLSAARANVGSAMLDKVAATVQVKPGLAAFDISDASAFGGTLQAGFRFDRQPQANQIEIRLLATDINGAMLAAAFDRKYFIPTGQGTLSFILKGKGNSLNDLLQNGDGSLTASFGQGYLPNLDLAALLESMKQGGFFAFADVSGGTLPINSAEFKSTISNGVARVEKAGIEAQDYAATLSGIVPYIGGGLALSGTLQPRAAQNANQTETDLFFFVGGTWNRPFIMPVYTNAPASAE